MKKIETIRLLWLISFTVLISCQPKQEEVKKVIRPVKAIQVTNIGSILDKTFPAQTKEAAEATLSFRVGGPLVRLNAEEGQRIRKGQLIAEIDSRDFTIDLEAKEGRYIQAKAEMERFERLLADRSVSRNEYEIKLAAFKEARAAYHDAQNAINDTKLFAPYNATINRKLAQNFEIVKAEQPVVSILDDSVMEVVFSVPEGFAPFVEKIKGFKVEFDTYPGKFFTASLKEIVPKAEGAAGGYPVYLYLDYSAEDEKKYPVGYGFTCKVTVEMDEENAGGTNEFLLPVHAVIEGRTDEDPSVMVFSEDDNRVHKRYVKIGGLGPNGTLRVIEGLEVDEWVVVYGVTQLVDGQETRLLSFNPTTSKLN